MNSQGLLDNLSEAISDLGEASEIQSVDWRSYHLLVAIRGIMSHRLRTSSFNPLIDEVSPPDTLERLSGLPEEYPIFKESEERELAWLILVLNEGLLGCYVKILGDNPSIAGKYYYSESVVTSCNANTIKLVDGLLNEKTFNLNFKDYAKYRQDQESAASTPPKSPSILSRRSPEQAKGLLDALTTSPKHQVSVEWKAIVEQTSRTGSPVIVIDQGAPAGESSTPSIYSPYVLPSETPSSAAPSTLSEDGGIIANLVKRALGKIAPPAHLEVLPPDLGLVYQRFQCAACNALITSDTSQRCINCGKYYCPDCLRPSNYAHVILGQVLQNWDFARYSCCNSCNAFLRDLDIHSVFIDISHIIEFALTIDDVFRKAWEKHTTALPAAIEITLPCLSAPDIPDFISSVRSARMSDIIMMHTQGTAPVIDMLELHLARCEECAGRASKCIVCGEGEPLVPLVTESAKFCANCLGAWHVDCEGHICPRCI